MTTQTTEPWQAFYDQPTFLPPGQLARWHREEAAIRAEEVRKDQERTERAEARQELALWEARQYSLARGLEWDPQRPFANVPDIYARADAAFAMQDREARANDLAAARDAGLVHLLHQGVPSPEEPEVGAAATSGTAQRANPVGTKIREAFARWARRSSTGLPTAGSRDLDEPREITRSTYQYER